MTLSVLNLGDNVLNHPFVDNFPLDTAQNFDFEGYDFIVVDPVSTLSLVSESFALEDISSLFTKSREMMYKFLEHGGRVVCFLRPIDLKQLSSSTVNNYSWLLNTSQLGNLPFIQPDAGTTLSLTDEAKQWTDYLEYKSLVYFASWEFSFERQRVISFSKNLKPIAIRIGFESGEILLLPPIRDADHQRLFVQALWRTIQDETDLVKELTPNWVQRFELRNIQQLQDDLAQLNTSIQDLILGREIKQQEIDYYSSFNDLLWETGKRLERAVQITFREVGFKAEPMGDVDLVLSSPEGMAYVEVHGTEGMLRVRKLDQLFRYLQVHKQDNSHSIKGIVVGNAFRDKPPDERGSQDSQFSLQVHEAAKTNNIALITTIDLFVLVDQVLMKESNEETVRRMILNTTGILSVN